MGSLTIAYGFLEVITTRIDIPYLSDLYTNKQQTPIGIPLEGYTHLSGVLMTLVTNDVYAVNNRIDGVVDVFTTDPWNVNQTYVRVYSHGHLGDINTKNPNDIKDFIDFSSSYGPKSFGHPNSTGSNVFEVKFNYTPVSEDPTDVLVFLQPKDGVWEYIAPINLPTIQSTNVLTDLKNSRVVEGLTWVIVGAIPVGLVSEFHIHSRIERYFFDLEKYEKSKSQNNPDLDPI